VKKEHEKIILISILVITLLVLVLFAEPTGEGKRQRRADVDLTVEFGDTTTKGETETTTLTIENKRKGDTGDFSVEVKEGNGKEIYSQTHSLGGREKKEIQVSFQLDEGQEKRIIVIVDGENKVAERKEDNNKREKIYARAARQEQTPIEPIVEPSVQEPVAEVVEEATVVEEIIEEEVVEPPVQEPVVAPVNPIPTPAQTVVPQPIIKTEKVTCVFSVSPFYQSKTPHSCSAQVGDKTFKCTGIDSCTVEVTGEKGKQPEWTSTCLNAIGTRKLTRKSFIDGTSERVVFGTSCTKYTKDGERIVTKCSDIENNRKNILVGDIQESDFDKLPIERFQYSTHPGSWGPAYVNIVKKACVFPNSFFRDSTLDCKGHTITGPRTYQTTYGALIVTSSTRQSTIDGIKAKVINCNFENFKRAYDVYNPPSTSWVNW
jgi:hypothetical protein